MPMFKPSASALPYKVYSALLSQSGTSAPVATVLQNTIGSIVWSRAAEGHYAATLAGAFTEGKTMIFVCPNTISQLGTIADANASLNTVILKIIDTSDSFAPVDGRMVGTSIEIRVYP